MMILKTEPGASCAWMALFSSGLPGSVTSAFHSLRVMRTANSLGSNAGRLTIARISPLRGSMATIAPGLPFQRFFSGDLQIKIDGELELLARNRGHIAERAQLPCRGC